MSDELSNYLLSNKTHSSVSPEALELMGKKAATSFLSEGIALNDSIAKLAAEYKDISPEQVKRVVEFANTNVYLAKHDQAKTAGSAHSYPQFELADAGRILQDLSDGARPTVVTKTDIDYSREAQKPKLASASLDQALEDLFKLKEASQDPEFSIESIADQLVSTKQSLINLHENLQDRFNQNESLFKEATAEFYIRTKEHLLEGGSLAEVYQAAASTGVSTQTVKDVFGPVVERLITEKVASPKALKLDMANLSKLAHREVNPEHDLVRSFSAAVMSGGELEVLSKALAEVDEELQSIRTFSKEALSKEGFAGAIASMAGRAIPAVTRFATRAMKRDPIGTLSMAKDAIGGIKNMAHKQPAPVPPMNTP